MYVCVCVCGGGGGAEGGGEEQSQVGGGGGAGGGRAPGVEPRTVSTRDEDAVSAGLDEPRTVAST